MMGTTLSMVFEEGETMGWLRKGLVVVCALALAACGEAEKGTTDIVQGGDFGRAPDVCVPYCGEEGEAECGDDGCGGTCGECGENEVCGPTGRCECEFLKCGKVCCTQAETSCDDGGCCEPYCGDSCWDDSCLSDPCGGCPDGQICFGDGEEYFCCEPSCAEGWDGQPCGSDGCGGSCGECAEGWDCVETDYDPNRSVCFNFEENCLQLCADRSAQCGPLWHGLGEGPMCDCGDCPEGQMCEEDNWAGGICVAEGGCEPDCAGKECGDDGCGGTCGTCGEGLECLNTQFGLKCTTPCELFSCPEGQFCLFGLCADKECESDADCGEAPAHYCDKYLQCRERKACEATDDCNTGNEEGYCAQDIGYCMYDGHCWDDADCSGGTCGQDHWCQDHNCYELYGPGCPPQLPICYMPSGEEPLCDGMPCASCMAPCIFDADCPEGLVCRDGGMCQEPGNNCVLDAECAEGQYCSPGCVDLKPACESEAGCAEGKLCLAGFCVSDQVVPCDSDEVCLAWAEGYTCQDGVCKPEGACVLDSQCEEGQYCHGICLPVPDLPDCKTDAGCSAGQICENELCQAPPECYYDTQCGAGQVCVDQHCYNDQGVCAWLEKGSGFCDDEDPCTTDSCDPETGCVHTPGACD